jgi:hypothetical protein
MIAVLGAFFSVPILIVHYTWLELDFLNRCIVLNEFFNINFCRIKW